MLKTRFGVLTLGVATALPAAAMAQSSTDLFQGAAIGNTTGLGSGNGSSPDGLFGGAAVGPESGNTIFDDATAPAVVGADPVHFLVFTPLGGPVTLTKIVAYLTTDGDGVSRKADDFTLIADTNGIAGFQANDTFVNSGAIAYNGRFATISLPFAVTASAFRFEVDPSETGPFVGVRVNELDGFNARPSLFFTGSQGNDLQANNAGLTNFATTAAGTTNAGVGPAGRDLVFAATANTTPASFNAVLGGNLTVNSVTFGVGAGATTPTTIGGTGTLTLNADPLQYAVPTGIAVAQGAAPVTISANVAVNQSQRWSNSGGSLTVAGGVSLAANTVTFTGDGTTRLTGAVTGGGGLTVSQSSDAGTVVLGGANAYTGVTTVTAGRLRATPPAYANFLTNAGGVEIDGGRVVLDYSGTTSPIAQVKNLLAMSAAGGFLTGQVRTAALPANRTIGYADNGTDSVTIRLTLPGDADVDGDVDFNDFLALQANFGTTGTRFDQGNFDYDAATDFNDFLALQANFGTSLDAAVVTITAAQVAAMTAFGQSVPEPAALASLGVAMVLAVRRRRIAE